jgi:hypothetical protein
LNPINRSLKTVVKVAAGAIIGLTPKAQSFSVLTPDCFRASKMGYKRNRNHFKRAAVETISPHLDVWRLPAGPVRTGGRGD